MREDMNRSLAWLSMLSMPDWGAQQVRRHVELVGDVLEAWEMCKKKGARHWQQSRDVALSRLEQSLQNGAQILTLEDPRYPSALAHIPDPPPVLFILGSMDTLAQSARALSVVGTRSCTQQGATWSREIGKEWTEAGGLLVSGLARGIDGCAHRGALTGTKGGRQIAVLPCSVHSIYPTIHESLARDLLEKGGVLLSEQPPKTPVKRWMFASRNRILAGLSSSTVVVQSPSRGGSLISARCAMDQDREVFTFWNQGMGRDWAGNRALVADLVARPVKDVAALWDELSKASSVRMLAGTTQVAGATVPEGCETTWRALKANRTLSWKQLILRTSLPQEDLKRQLFTLEIRGWIRRAPGRSYVRC